MGLSRFMNDGSRKVKSIHVSEELWWSLQELKVEFKVKSVEEVIERLVVYYKSRTTAPSGAPSEEKVEPKKNSVLDGLPPDIALLVRDFCRKNREARFYTRVLLKLFRDRLAPEVVESLEREENNKEIACSEVVDAP